MLPKHCPQHPTQPFSSLAKKEKTAPNYLYLSAIGHLLWLSITICPDIAYIVNSLARHTHTFTEVHITAVKRVVRYLNFTYDLGITYCGRVEDPKPIICLDTSFAD